PERLDARETTLARHCKRDLLGVILSKPLDAIHSEAKRRRGARGGTVESETRMIIVAWIRPFASLRSGVARAFIMRAGGRSGPSVPPCLRAFVPLRPLRPLRRSLLQRALPLAEMHVHRP